MDKELLNSPIGRAKFAETSSKPQQKVYSVPNMSANSTTEEFFDFNEVSKIRAESIQNKNKLNNSAKEKIEFLLGMKRKTKDVIIDEIKFKIQTLKTKEIKFILSEVAKETNDIGVSQALALMSIKVNTVALIITHIDDQPIEFIFGTNDFAQIKEYVNEMNDDVVDTLYSEYLTLKQKHEIKNDKEAEEAVENLKK